MVKAIPKTTVFSTRLKQARVNAGYTQIELGAMAGIDEFTASARINQYERAVHTPNFGMAERLAAALGVPVSFFYEPDDRLAKIILIAGQLTEKNQEKLIAAGEAMI